MEPLAVPHGLNGLIDGCFEEAIYLGPETVSDGGSPIQRGRSERFCDRERQRQAAGQIEARGVEGVVILGGGGSVQATDALSRQGVPCVCVPVTIDNDVWGTDYTLGFDSGVHHILGIAAAIRDTSLALSAASSWLRRSEPTLDTSRWLQGWPLLPTSFYYRRCTPPPQKQPCVCRDCSTSGKKPW